MISKDELIRLFEVSKILYKDDELLRIANEMSGIIELTDKIEDVELTNSKDFENKIEFNDLKADIKGEPLSVYDILKNAEEVKENGFVVPRVV